MKIAENLFVSLAYQLNVNGEVVDSANAERPLDFIFGMGMLLPAFEAQIADKQVGDSFSFTLTPEEGYGVYNDQAVVDLPKDIFNVDGVVAEDLLVVGNALPMGDSQGNRMMGVIKAIGETTVSMDFNHPMAGKTLDFSGSVLAVREANEEDSAKFFGTGGGCSCGEGGCGSDCQGGCDEGCDCEK